jgi:hypothetical protein
MRAENVARPASTQRVAAVLRIEVSFDDGGGMKREGFEAGIIAPLTSARR